MDFQGNLKTDLGNKISSPEGHALVSIFGTGFGSLQNSEISCLFQHSTTTYKISSKILKDKTVCEYNNYDCYFGKTDQEFSDKQIACYTPKIPLIDRPLLGGVWERFILYLRVDNIDYTCDSRNDCTLTYDLAYPTRLNYIIPQHAYYGSQIQINLSPNRSFGSDNEIENPVENALMSIKVGVNNCIFPTIFNNEQPVIKKLIETNKLAQKEMWRSAFNCYLGDGIPEVIPKNGFLLNLYSGVPAFREAMVVQDLDGNDYSFKLYPKIDLLSRSTVSIYGGTELTFTGKGFIQGNFGKRVEVYIDDKLNTCKVTKITNTKA